MDDNKDDTKQQEPLSDDKSNSCYIHEKQLLSRLLYPNPVCLLSLTSGSLIDADKHFRNVMAVTWLMPVDNQANILLSLNANRFTAEKIAAMPIGSPFVLNVPSSVQQELVLKIGQCSGRDIDKFSFLNIESCLPGWQDNIDIDSFYCTKNSKGKMSKRQLKKKERDSLCSETCAVSCCIAHIVCTVLQCTESCDIGFTSSNHIILSAEITCAYVKAEYWNGKNFISRSPDIPHILSFLGSGEFANMVKASMP